MKKIVLIAGAMMALFSFRAFAQEEDNRLELAASKSGIFELDAISHTGFGYNLLKSEAFECSESGEFFINILNMRIFPVNGIGIELGIDYKTMDFNSKEYAFYLDGDKKIQAGKTADLYPGDLKKFRSRFRSNTFCAPIMLKFEAGTTSLGLGVEGNMNLAGRVKNKYFQNDKKVKDIKKGAQFTRYNYNFLATLSFDGTGVYFRYYPKSVQILPEGSIKANFMAVGVIFDM